MVEPMISWCLKNNLGRASSTLVPDVPPHLRGACFQLPRGARDGGLDWLALSEGQTALPAAAAEAPSERCRGGVWGSERERHTDKLGPIPAAHLLDETARQRQGASAARCTVFLKRHQRLAQQLSDADLALCVSHVTHAAAMLPVGVAL